MNTGLDRKQINGSLPWWTWMLPCPLLIAGGWLAQFFETAPHVSILYLPIPLGILLAHWWGPRVLIWVLVSDVVCVRYFWGAEWDHAAYYGMSDLIAVAGSYLIHAMHCRRPIRLGSINRLLRFLIFGAAVPLALAACYTYWVGTQFERIKSHRIVFLWVADMLGVFLICVPMIYFCSVPLAKRGWALVQRDPHDLNPVEAQRDESLKLHWNVGVALGILVYFLAVIFPLDDYWYLFGIAPLMSALYFGYPMAIVIASLSIAFTLILPVLIWENPSPHPFWVAQNIGLAPSLSMLMLTAASVLTGRAISDRKLSEERTLDAFHRAETELAEVRDELVGKTRLAAIGQVSAGIAHEMRTPLGAIRNACYFLRNHPDVSSVKRDEYLNLINDEIATADRIITNLLSLVRSAPLKKSSVKYTNYMESAVKRLADRKTRQSVKVTAEPDDLEILIDEDRFRYVADNLLVNAFQASEPRGQVVCHARRDGDDVVLEFANSGDPVPPQDRDKIFEPLFTTKPKGTGLGLAICREIVQKHGGEIRLMSPSESNIEPRMTVFEIILPSESDGSNVH